MHLQRARSVHEAHVIVCIVLRALSGDTAAAAAALPSRSLRLLHPLDFSAASIAALPRCSEVAMGSKVIVQMNGAKTTLLDPSGAVQPKEFTFDFSYWSFDAAAPNFATNPKVYSDLGVSVLNNAWLGFNCCLEWGTPVLTSSGKSILIEEVTTEHELLGPDGKPRRVEAVDTSLVRPELVEVSDADGRSYRVTLDHQLTFVWSRDPVWVAVPDEKCISVVGWNKHASAAHPIGERLTFSQRYYEPELPQSECNDASGGMMSLDRAVEEVNRWLQEHSLRSGELVEVLAEDFLRRWDGLNGAVSPDVAAHGVALAAAVLPDLDLASNLPVIVRPVRLNEPRLISQKAGDAPFQVVEIQVDGDSRYVLANGSVTHNCLFAYGQTGSGKSYSMVGYGEDKGIVPQAMEEMFARISRNKDKNVKFSVEASMVSCVEHVCCAAEWMQRARARICCLPLRPLLMPSLTMCPCTCSLPTRAPDGDLQREGARPVQPGRRRRRTARPQSARQPADRPVRRGPVADDLDQLQGVRALAQRRKRRANRGGHADERDVFARAHRLPDCFHNHHA